MSALNKSLTSCHNNENKTFGFGCAISLLNLQLQWHVFSLSLSSLSLSFLSSFPRDKVIYAALSKLVSTFMHLQNTACENVPGNIKNKIKKRPVDMFTLGKSI